MKTILLLLSFTIFASETCDKKKKQDKTTDEAVVATPPEEQSGVPKCIQTKIDSLKKVPRYNPPAEVNEYTYNGKRAFLFSSDCCDNYNVLLDENCNYLCAPSGGFTGKGDMKCTDFTEKAKLVKLIWKDERK